MGDCIARNQATQTEGGFLFLGNIDDEKRSETRMTNVLETGCYSCDLKSYGEPFQAVWKKAKAGKPYCFIVSGSATTAGYSVLFWYLQLEKRHWWTREHLGKVKNNSWLQKLPWSLVSFDHENIIPSYLRAEICTYCSYNGTYLQKIFHGTSYPQTPFLDSSGTQAHPKCDSLQ